MKIIISFAFVALCFFSSAAAQPCLDAAKVVPPTMSEETRKVYLTKLAEAEKVHLDKPNDADSIIWLGRRTAYLGEYKNAIRIFSSGIVLHPNDARLYRHRGHRYITIRCFDDAIKDFEKAAALVKGKPDEVEPDGLPNAKNIPTSTLQSNIWYHIGLAYYLKGDLSNAIRAYEECQKVSKNNDMRVATTYWHYMTLRRAGKKKDAEKMLKSFNTNLELIENTDYLKLLKLNKGEVKAEYLLATIRGDANTLGSASLGYGIGNYFLYNGDREKAIATFRKILQGDQWASFGYIAAETDLAR
ncbi:tetratricopeptide repeat protein [Leptolyngbya sp. 7M]|uniref:tetratricopeptide repeat protein n=1 Tax=Leptolyngbya sp. 7M TaxID=2812896 RepID=UPI001B8AA025|nr:tetratricopeptide repeat protein [Leptolyngbya sp. 7M]QYO67468.1 tetratricopeptide repeat protein [Leptolyngbya sp. 7M]